jgi:hypothetical protein
MIVWIVLLVLGSFAAAAFAYLLLLHDIALALRGPG